MKESRFVAFVVACGLWVGALAGPVVVKTVNHTWEVVVADDVMDPPAVGDAAPAIQARLDALGASGGGTLFLKAGTYRLVSPIMMPINTCLKGDYAPSAPRKSTVLAIVGGRGDEDGEPAFRMGTSSALQGLFFHYPEQSLDSPIPYPWTVRAKTKPRRAPDHQTIRDCTFVNAWQAIAIGPEPNELHTFRDVRICALKTGFAVDSTTDIGRIIDVEVSPRVWARSGLPGSPDERRLREWLLAHDTLGAWYGRSDWEYIWRLKVDGYRTGCRFTQGKRGTSNAVMDESAFVGCDTGLEVDRVNGVGLAVYDTRFDCIGTSAHMTTNFATVVQFLACDFGGKPPVNDGKQLSNIIVKEGKGEPVRHVPMVWPRLSSDRLVTATDFGLSTNADNNAAALQRALDAAKGGGTVYVPSGMYSFKGPVTVPTGVELRGSSAAPHHTAAGGSVLLVRYGRGDEDGIPFISLATGAGLRGVLVWYPENPILDPEPYPWAVQSLGEDTWLVDVCIANAWRGVDFASHPSGGHRIAYLSGVAWQKMLSIANSSRRGWVEETLFNPHYSQRLAFGLPHVMGKPPAECPSGGVNIPVQSWNMRRRLEAHAFKDCADERIRGTFVFAAKDGMSFRGRNSAKIVMHGADTIACGVELEQSEGGRVDATLVQVTPYETASGKESSGFHFAPGDRGTAVFRASQLWVLKPSVIAEGGGLGVFEMANSLSGPIYARKGRLELEDFRFSSSLEECVLKEQAVKVRVERTGEFPMPDSLCPNVPPVDVNIDCETTRPLENKVARWGGVRGHGDWCCRVDGSELLFRAELKDPAYAFVYADIWEGRSPVWPKTRLKYRMKPTDDNSSRTVSLDLAFDDGTQARILRGLPVGKSLPPGEWTDVSIPLRCYTGKTIVRIMVRADRRFAPGTYEARLDDIRIVTAR